MQTLSDDFRLFSAGGVPLIEELQRFRKLHYGLFRGSRPETRIESHRVLGVAGRKVERKHRKSERQREEELVMPRAYLMTAQRMHEKKSWKNTERNLRDMPT